MALKDLTAREIFLGLLGFGIAQLLIMTVDRLYGHEYVAGVVFFAFALGLAIVFFRTRKIVLALSGLSYILVTAGLTVPFHPSMLAWTLTVGSAAGLYWIIRWGARKYPHLTRADMHKVFEGDDAMETTDQSKHGSTIARH